MIERRSVATGSELSKQYLVMVPLKGAVPVHSGAVMTWLQPGYSVLLPWTIFRNVGILLVGVPACCDLAGIASDLAVKLANGGCPMRNLCVVPADRDSLSHFFGALMAAGLLRLIAAARGA